MAGAPARLGRRARRAASRSASTPSPSIRRALPGVARARTASPATRGCSSTPAASRPKSISTSSPMRWPARRAVRAARHRRRPGAAAGRARMSSSLPFVASTRRARHRAGERRRVRARRRPGDLRPVGARGDGVRHADRRARCRGARRAGRWRLRRRRRARRRPRPSPKPSPRSSKRDRARAAQRGAPSRRSERLAARAAGAGRALPAPARRRGRRSPPARRAMRDRRRPCSDERAIDADTTAGRTLCIVLHDVAPSTRVGLHARAEGDAPTSRRRAADAAGGAALPRRTADARVRRLARRARQPRRRARAARPHPSRRPAPPQAWLDRLRRIHYTRGEGEFWALSRGRGAAARIDVGIAWFRAERLAAARASSRRPGCSGPGAWPALASGRSSTRRRCARSSTCRAASA